jgi:hypothetical protein
LSGSDRRIFRRTRPGSSEARTEDFQQPGHANEPKLGETSTIPSKRLWSEGSTPTDVARETKRPRDIKGPGTYTEILTTIKMAIYKQLYPEDNLNEDDQQSILDVLGEMIRRAPVEELSHLKSYRLEGGELIYICAPTVWSVTFRSH